MVCWCRVFTCSHVLYACPYAHMIWSPPNVFQRSSVTPDRFVLVAWYQYSTDPYAYHINNNVLRPVATTSHVTPSHATTPAYNPNIHYEHTSTYAIRMTPSRYTRTVPMEQYYYILHYLGTVFKTKRVLGQENSMSGGRVYFCVRRTIRPEWEMREVQ